MLCCRRRRRRRRRCSQQPLSSGGGGVGGCAGLFPGGVVFNDLFPCQRWGWRCRTFKVGEERYVLEDMLEECGPRVIRHGFEVRHSPLVGS